MNTTTPAGWFADGSGRPGTRWWDGNAWTSWVHVDGRVVDEAAAADSAPQEPAVVEPVTGGPTPGFDALASQPFLVYLEREPAVVGGRIDIAGADGTVLGVAEAQKKSRHHGAFSKEVPIFVTDASGACIGGLVRKSSLGAETHPILDGNGAVVGEFVGQALGRGCTARMAGGVELTLTLHQRENWLQDAHRTALAKIVHADNFRIVELDSIAGFNWGAAFGAQHNADRFVLQPLVALPPWLFLVALLAPIESNLRLDTSRVTD